MTLQSGAPKARHHIETIAVHAGNSPDSATGAVTQPIHLSTTFARREDGSLPSQYLYARSDNPTRRALEECLAELEGTVAANSLAFSSGLAAVGAVFQSLRPGDHVLAPTSVYYGTTKWLSDVIGPWGLESSYVDMSNPAAVRAAMRLNTKLVWVETPSNPTLDVTDVAAVADIAHSSGALLACDNTWPTPLLQRPFELGADIIIHSTTKYLGGHSDVTGGAVLVSPGYVGGQLVDRLRLIQTQGGAVPSAFDCWLVMRGIRSLPCRMRVHCDNAERIARFLLGHPAVEVVHYPGLPSDPGFAIATKQMSRFGGVVSVQIRGGAEGALGVLSRVQLFLRATSLGGTESLIEHRASVEGPTSPTPKGLLRISVGLEHPDDLINDLEQALASA
ncbi:MAG: PLP-dependent transferase [Gemmatimonadota bacterium]|nr:PLP-dependent transferase [Gemmatimonadota bacterium]